MDIFAHNGHNGHLCNFMEHLGAINSIPNPKSMTFGSWEETRKRGGECQTA